MTMTTCANNHVPITHDEFHCPLCEAIDLADDEIQKVQKLEDQAADLQERLNHIGNIDAEALEAAAQAAEVEAYDANKRFDRLSDAIRYHRGCKTLTARLQQIDKAHSATLMERLQGKMRATA
jgi:outer membrane murein-binding lipoprotein Lpp